MEVQATNKPVTVSEVSNKAALECSEAEFSGPCILGTGAAFGNYHYTCEEMRVFFHKQRAAVGDTKYEKEFVDKIFDRVNFDGNSVMSPPEDVFRTLSRPEYIKARREQLGELAERACRKAIANWGGKPEDITHLYWGTMTGAMDSPTLDIVLTKKLGLSFDVKRTSIEGMGCLSGFRLMNLAAECVESAPEKRILVIEGDIRSLIGNSLPKDLVRADIISAALFRDSASACVIGSVPRPDEKVHYEYLGGKSRILENSSHLAEYVELEEGAIRLHLERELPDALEAHDHDFVYDLIKEASMKFEIPDIKEFDIACHTGGPRILKCVAKGLKIDDEEHMKSSWRVMKAHGNLSGSSNMSVLDDQNKRGGRDWVIGLSMGPGIAIESVLLRRPKNYDRKLFSV